MKKMIGILLSAMLIAGVCTVAYAADTDNTITVIVDGQKIDFPDAPAYIDSANRTQVPARFIGEALGASVTWKADLKMAEFARFSHTFHGEIVYLDFQMGVPSYYVRGYKGTETEKRPMETTAVINEERIYIPVRYVAEGLEARVDWDAGARTVTITSKTKKVGVYTIPQSFTGDVVYGGIYSDGMKATRFDMGIGNGRNTTSDISIRTEQFLTYIVSQTMDSATIEKMRKFFEKNRDATPISMNEPIAEVILDETSGQYVRMLRSSLNTFSVRIYDKGIMPPKSGF
ncbi:hypothetical protein AGMMS49975_02230 [Clostridia bacterium]|nr:hypothetical protein AGMMS49975_02230 [Clostridia bacterium]